VDRLDRRGAIRALSTLALAIPACRRGEPRESSTTTSTSTSAASNAPSASETSAAPSTSASTEPKIVEAPYPQAAPKELIANDELALHDWALPGQLARRAVVLVPRHLTKGERVPLLVLLHGLAETVDEEMGAYAWVRRYGVGDGYAHLRAPSTITMEGLGKMATEARITELHQTLAQKPFRGMVIACPYTPNIWKVSPDLQGTLDVYAQWIFEVLIPRLRSETPVMIEDAHAGLDGVSLGGHASLGVGARRAAQLGSIGCVQAAIAAADADTWADRFGKAFAVSGPRPLGLLTSTMDVFRKPVEALDAALTKRGIAHDFRLAIGPHDQPFLRGPGSLEMLLWHARALDG